MGLYDDIRTNSNEAQEMVENQFSITQNWATTMMNQTLSFLNAMNTTSSFVVPSITLEHSLPASLDISDFAAVAPGEMTLSYTTPARPSVSVSSLSGIFSFSGALYSSEIIEGILSKISGTLSNGGTGLGAAVEAALWARALTRKEAKDAALYTEADDYFASRGWVLPVGMHSGRLLEIQKEISREDALLNYEIMTVQAQLADQNTRHNLEQAVGLEGLLRDYYLKNEALKLEVSKAYSTATVQEFTANVEAGKLQLSIYETDVQAMISLIEAQVKAYLGRVQAYESQATAYKATVEAKATAFAAEASVVKTEADIELAKLDAQIKAFLGVAQLRASTAEGAARVSAQVAAGAMSAVNAGVSFSYGANQSASGSDSTSTQFSYANDVQEILYAYE